MRNTGSGAARRVLVAVGIAAGFASAAEPAAEDTKPGQLPDIVVTATRTEQSSFNVPASICFNRPNDVCVPDLATDFALEEVAIANSPTAKAAAAAPISVRRR